jgi:hypothetical protein
MCSSARARRCSGSFSRSVRITMSTISWLIVFNLMSWFVAVAFAKLFCRFGGLDHRLVFLRTPVSKTMGC